MATSRKPPALPQEAPPTPALKGRRKRRQSLQLALVDGAGRAPLPEPVLPLRQLWLGIHLPALPLEAVINPVVGAAAVFEDQQGVRRILLANARARAVGISPGMPVNAALALEPDLLLEARQPSREARTLQALAGWAEKFTAFTSIEAPALLLLEIAGSLTLFGGIRALRQRVVHELDRQGFQTVVAIAPTPLAATWLARAGQRACIRDPRSLVGKLGPLPLSCLGWPDSVCAALHGMGITTIGEALRLPRQGFAKRFGAMRLLELDRAFGHLPDPRVNFRAPDCFVADLDLTEEVSDATLLLNACRELLLRLEHFLLSRQMAVQHIEFSFFHQQMAATGLSLGCVQADRDAQRWFKLLEIKFERVQLSAPVLAIRLCAGQGLSFVTETAALPFHREDGRQRYRSIAHLAERLSARIGDESVHGVMVVAEHRPQYAWRPTNVLDAIPHCAHPPTRRADPHVPVLLAEIRRTNSLVQQRPLWMLAEPQPLEVEEGRPCYQGVLRLVTGPERIETGWWDEEGIARDYFVAVNPAGVHLWIFRNRSRDKRWYLHGKFG